MLLGVKSAQIIVLIMSTYIAHLAETDSGISHLITQFPDLKKWSSTAGEIEDEPVPEARLASSRCNVFQNECSKAANAYHYRNTGRRNNITMHYRAK